jgi:acyl-coenzyme A thioesterase PaaI-like protein
VIKAGRTLTVVRADVHAYSSEGDVQLIATMQGTMMSLKK